MRKLHAIHPSVHPRCVRTPYNMNRLRGANQEQIDALTAIAMDIFADCANVGVPFQESLLAIYLSGLQHGSEISKEHVKDTRHE